jgi:hypothetical protein
VGTPVSDAAPVVLTVGGAPTVGRGASEELADGFDEDESFSEPQAPTISAHVKLVATARHHIDVPQGGRNRKKAFITFHYPFRADWKHRKFVPTVG